MSELLGFAFPFRIAPSGPAGGPRLAGVRRAAGAEKIRDDVRHLLLTRVGERLMLRAYGGGVQHSLQEPKSSTLRALVRHEIEQALRVYLPDARLSSPITFDFDESELQVSFEYTTDLRNLVHRLEVTV
jgi:phage baseplate assembly protein W